MVDSASAPAAPSGVVTFLFTDVEGSTRRWEADADGMRVALAAHDEVLRQAIEAHGGWLFKHTGDGVCAAFASPRSAVDAAVAAQQALELPVRMGIATGEAELRDGDYFGAALNRVARVMAAGHGGQVLLTDSTAGLLSGVDLMDLGSRRLRDLPAPVQVFQVQADGLRTDFPPLRALDVGPGNLRPAATSFIGREYEAGEVQAAVKAHRLVTLTGVGGVGKTRLAREVAGRLVDEFPDGVWFFELAAVKDPAAVPDAVAAVLGVTQQPGRSVTESVTAALDGRGRLLVFDNCEHVLDAAADLIDAIPSTNKIVTTSREALGVDDEQLWLVPSLDVGAGVVSAAVELFVERARSVASRFSLASPGEADAVVEICRHLDGIPLAIELAASRMASMTASEVQDRLDQRFRLLVGSRRGLERHHTLRHAVAWSYDLLDDTEKMLLNRCSVFAGGFTLHSACAVAGLPDESDDYAILDLLDALVRKSLLVADRSSGRTRYSMLETIRQFAAEQLDHRESSEIRFAHARYYAGREPEILALWDSPQQRQAYDLFGIELANLRTAFRWAADHDDLDVAATIATCAAWFGFLTEKYEPIAWAEELIEPARAVDHPRLAFLYVMAAQCYMAGRIEAAVGYSDAGQQVIAGGAKVPFGVGGWLGTAYVAIGQAGRWVDWCRVQLARGGDTHAVTRGCLPIALTLSGSSDEAMTAAEGLIDAAEATGNPYALAFALYAYGFAYRDADPLRSLAAGRRGLAVARDSGNRTNVSSLAAMLCQLASGHGDPVTALEYFATAIGNFHDSGNTFLTRGLLGSLATFFDRLGRYQAAATFAGFAVASLVQPTGFDAAVTHLRAVLGEETYETLSQDGGAMTTAEMVTYAFAQIDQTRTELASFGENVLGLA